MLDATDVQIDRQPVFSALVQHGIGVGAGVARKVPAGLHKGVEGIGVALGRIALGVSGLDKRLVFFQGRA